jgi:anti-sigma regulatory factor (Ser/Thr protein kinase)
MTARCWRHDMFVYDADDAFAGLVAPYLDEGLEEGDALMAVFVPEKQSLLRDALGRSSDTVDFTDANDVYTRPEAVLARYDAAVRRLLADGARSIRLIGELPIWETQQQWDVWIRYDGLLNHAFTHLPVRVACAYDARVVPDPVLRESRRAHPLIHHGDWDGGEWHESHDFDPTEVVRSMTPDPPPLPQLREVSVGEDARSFRERLMDEMAAADVPSDQAYGMLLAAAEVYANTMRHGEGTPSLRVGRVDEGFVCELSDGGVGLDDPLAGYLPPRENGPGRAGLWVARQSVRRLEHLAASGGGLTTRLWA